VWDTKRPQSGTLGSFDLGLELLHLSTKNWILLNDVAESFNPATFASFVLSYCVSDEVVQVLPDNTVGVNAVFDEQSDEQIVAHCCQVRRGWIIFRHLVAIEDYGHVWVVTDLP